MKLLSLGFACLAVAAVLASASVQAASRQTCLAAVRDKRPCAGTRNASPERNACFTAAMQRCRKGGPGAI